MTTRSNTHHGSRTMLRNLAATGAITSALLLAACGSGGGDSSSNPGASASGSPADAASAPSGGAMQPGTVSTGVPAGTTPPSTSLPDQPTTTKDASRLMQQASFGADAASVEDIARRGVRKWLVDQFAMTPSSYALRDRDAIHKWTDRNTGYCDQFAAGSTQRDNCWRDWYSGDPLRWDFWKAAITGADQLRQRVAFVLSQIVVVSELEIEGTYGLADYHQMLRDRAFDNYRDILRAVTLHPVMGTYLNMVDNDAQDPNENYARELLQLFAIGTCELNADGTLKNGACKATYDNNTVRQYAYALSGWTYPAGGLNPWCTPMTKCDWKNPTYLKGAMVGVTAKHDNQPRTLLSGVNVPSGRTPQQALELVLDSLMNHPNTGPFVVKQLIQHLVTSNPSPAYVSRVVAAFNAGVYGGIGAGRKGDMKATLAAILLDAEARDPAAAESANYGRIKDPVFVLAAPIRALSGRSDGAWFGRYGIGGEMAQAVFAPPSVFSFYPSDGTLPGQPQLAAPGFGISNANTHLRRINYANDLIYWWYNKGNGLAPDTRIPSSVAIGTKVSYAAFEPFAVNSADAIDRLDLLLTGGRLNTGERNTVAGAMNIFTTAENSWLTDANNASNYQRERVKTAAYLILSSPHFQLQR